MLVISEERELTQGHGLEAARDMLSLIRIHDVILIMRGAALRRAAEAGVETAAFLLRHRVLRLVP